MPASNEVAYLSARTDAAPQTLASLTALVTGAASGSGRAIAIAYARAGARVVVCDHETHGGRRTVALIREAGGEAVFVACDVTSPESQEALVEHAVRHYGALHVACNNAGIGGESHLTASYPIAEWRRVVDLNLSAVFYGMRAQIPALISAGGGVIVNVVSLLGSASPGGAPAFTAARHGVVGLTQASGAEYAAQGVRVNAVGPACAEPTLAGPPDREVPARQAVLDLRPIGRIDPPDGLVERVLWLSSAASSPVTGSFHAVERSPFAR